MRSVVNFLVGQVKGDDLTIVNVRILGFGFCLPLFFFVAGCWLRRGQIKALVAHPAIRDERRLVQATAWLAPISFVAFGNLIAVYAAIFSLFVEEIFAEDSTGLKLRGAGEWLFEKHGTSKRRTWRKLHVGNDQMQLACSRTW